MSLRCVALLFFAALVLDAAGRGALAAETTGQPLPRFVSLRANEVNLRTGPGVQYPIDWVYKRNHLPVEIIVEYDTWRKVRDWQGTEGWVHKSMLGKHRTVVVTGKLRTLRNKSDTTGRPIAQAEPGVIARLLECPDAGFWCRVEVDGFEGWLRRVEFWGVHRDEVVR